MKKRIAKKIVKKTPLQIAQYRRPTIVAAHHRQFGGITVTAPWSVAWVAMIRAALFPSTD